MFYEFSAYDIVFHYVIESHLAERARLAKGGELFSAKFAEFMRPLFRDSASGGWEDILEKTASGRLDVSLVVARFHRGIGGGMTNVTIVLTDVIEEVVDDTD